MNNGNLVFVIPTYRLREVGETIRQYDEHFWRNGHVVDLIVFDDSSTAAQQKYFATLEETATFNDLYYVGPREKDAFGLYLNQRLRDRKLEPLVNNLFRPSYGGNRNVALMYTLGGLVVSADDDMRPYALVEDSPESLGDDEICRGKLLHANANGFTQKSFDILAAFLEVLGKQVCEVPSNHLRGKLVQDTGTDLLTNATRGLARENSLVLEGGPIRDDAVVKVAQTFRSGTSDADALDYLEMALDDEGQTRLEELNHVYVLVNFRPTVTKENWRIDCGVAGYDNTFGLPPFFPTRLRFEDYSFRLWVQQQGVASAHVDAAQTHVKSNYMRNPLAVELFNEEICNLLKRSIQSTLTHSDDLSIAFDYDGDVTLEDSERILERVVAVHRKVMDAAHASRNLDRGAALRSFAVTLEKAFYGFEPDFFQQNLIRIVDDVISQFKGSLEIWPTLVEIAYLQKRRTGLPIQRVANPRRRRAAA
jgi:glycosyltransferase involved in cell wall biosynthesis